MILLHEVRPCQMEICDKDHTIKIVALMLIYQNLCLVMTSFSFASFCTSKSRNNSIYKSFPQLKLSTLYAGFPLFLLNCFLNRWWFVIFFLPCVGWKIKGFSHTCLYFRRWVDEILHMFHDCEAGLMLQIVTVTRGKCWASVLLGTLLMDEHSNRTQKTGSTFQSDCHLSK